MKGENFSILIVFYLTISSGQNVIDPIVQAKIDSFLLQVMEDKHIPGLGLGIVTDNGSLYYANGYGYANLEAQTPTTQNTLFAIASLSKSFTATIVVKTLSELFPELGFDVLNTPIRTLVPSYNLTLIDRFRSEKTTFKDLLSHRVCTLPEHLGMWIGAFNDKEDMLYRQRYAPASCEFRGEYVYNNGLIALAGDIVAHMSNSTFEEMIADFLDQLGMKDTTWIQETDEHNSMPGRSVPYIWKDGEYTRYNPELLKSVTVMTAAAGLISSASDMLKYANFHLNLGKVGDKQIVPAEALLWMRGVYNPLGEGVVKTKPEPDARLDYWVGSSLCLVTNIHDGWTKLWHDGFLPPYESYISLYPELKLGIFTSWNGPGTLYGSDTPVDQIHNRIFDFVQEIERVIESKHLGISAEKQKELNVVNFEPSRISSFKLSQEQILGSYGSPLNGEMNIILGNSSHAYWEYGRWGKAWLSQVSGSSFEIIWDSDFWMWSWTKGRGMSNFTLNFLDVDTVQFLEEGQQFTADFERGLEVGDLPEVPWLPDSCLV